MSSSPKTLFTKRFGKRHPYTIWFIRQLCLLPLLPSIQYFWRSCDSWNSRIFGIDFAGVTLWHILKTESTISWHHSAALRLLPLGGACFSKDFNFLIQWYKFWFLGCEFNKTTMVGSWGIVPRMLVFFGFEI
ncbi:uncharacterized protein LOC117927309 isoform X1 [Vitis riparia]|uniref:uncharacterized protein LOC117927309 isoform X1 n=1 Tax=Vitis riparia TaxID=96939 RepID=UPI00155AF5BD|nr:uncharacterized protein LOC117927309 isoform X1 [Vitis riparia]